MKKFLTYIAFILLFPISVFGFGPIFFGGSGGSGAATVCDGTAVWEGAPGAIEQFENSAGDGNFCTIIKSGPVDWAITEGGGGGGVVNTYDSAQYRNGTHSISFTDDSALAGETAFIRANITDQTDDDFSFKFWVRLPDVSGWTNDDAIRIVYAPAVSGSAVLVTLKKISGALAVKFKCSGGDDTSSVTFTENSWYRFDIDILVGNYSTLKIYDNSYEIKETLQQVASSNDITDIYFGMHYNTVDVDETTVIYMDDLLFNSAGD